MWSMSLLAAVVVVACSTLSCSDWPPFLINTTGRLSCRTRLLLLLLLLVLDTLTTLPRGEMRGERGAVMAAR